MQNNKEGAPRAHYKELYSKTSAAEISLRTGVSFADGGFELTFLGTNYKISHPDFSAEPQLHSAFAEILVLRYLIEGKLTLSGGKFLAYRDMPWGEVYASNFNGRCILRFAKTFGAHPETLKFAMEEFSAKSAADGDISYELEFITGLTLKFILWLGDEEFAPSAQILFSDNFSHAFTAEDMAVAGEVAIAALSAAAKGY